MVRLWDEASETRVYEPRSGDASFRSYWTQKEIEESDTAEAPQERRNGIIIAWVDGVFYRAPEVKHAD